MRLKIILFFIMIILICDGYAEKHILKAELANGDEITGKLKAFNENYIFIIQKKTLFKIRKDGIDKLSLEDENISVNELEKILPEEENKINWNRYPNIIELPPKKKEKSIFSSIFNFFDDFKNPPDSLIAQTNSKNNVILNWKDLYKEEKWFVLEKKIGKEKWIQNYAKLPENKTVFQEKIKNFNQIIKYRVYALNDDKKTPFSNAVSISIFKDSLVKVPQDYQFKDLKYNVFVSKTEVSNKEYCEMLNYALQNNLIIGNFEENQTVKNLAGLQKELIDLDDRDCQISFENGEFLPLQGKDNLPVVEVTWYGAAFYCNVLNQMLNDFAGFSNTYLQKDWKTKNSLQEGYRLPSQGEWQYIATYNDGRKYPWGNEFAENMQVNGKNSGNKQSVDIEQHGKDVSELGIFHLGANVSEWVNNNWKLESEINLGNSTRTKYKAVCGGNFMSLETGLECNFVTKNEPEKSFEHIGFRIIRIAHIK